MKRKIFRKVALVIAAVLVLAAVGAYVVTAHFYRQTFDLRFTTAAEDTYSVEQFPAMTAQRHTFSALQGHTLVGYLYQNADGSDAKALVVFAHGLGAGGQRRYLPIVDYLVRSGYCVFAYDASGNDESDGVIGGFPQGIADLDHAVTYAQQLKETADLPLILFGYSWGALSATNVLNMHPEAAAVVSVAGCNRSLDLMEYLLETRLGEASKLFLPLVSLHESVTFGDYGSTTAMDGFIASDCGVLIVHGTADTVVPMKYGYDLYAQTYENDPRFTFLRCVGRGHKVFTAYYKTLDTKLMDQIVAFCDGWVES